MTDKRLETVSISQINNVPAAKSKARQASLIEVGQVEVVKLRPDGNGRYNIVDGRRRIINLTEAGVETVEAIIEPMTDSRAALVGLISHAGRSASPMVECRQIVELLNDGWTQERIAKAIGRSQGWVSERLSYLDLIPEFQDRLDRGEITIATARTLRKLDKAAQRAVLNDDGKVTADEAQEALRRSQAIQLDIDIPEIEPDKDGEIVLSQGQLETLARGEVAIIVVEGMTWKVTVQR